MTPMMEKFYQKRLEERSLVFSYNGLKDKIQVESSGFKFFMNSPVYYCPICGPTEIKCPCKESF